MEKYIYEYAGWRRLLWDEGAISLCLGKVRHLQGRLTGQMRAVGFSHKASALLETLTGDIVKSSEIEGERLQSEQVRSSLARKLGIPFAGLLPPDRNVEGIVQMLLDATQNFKSPLTQNRLFGWHAALFPTGRSGMQKIQVGRYRRGPMHIVSGSMGKEKIHYKAPPPEIVSREMRQFLTWFNSRENLDSVLKAAVAHFRFVIIHPFDDGNGRIARALSDMLLARSEGTAERYYSMSSQISAERKRYYAVLQEVQTSRGDITAWLDWFLGCLSRALLAAENRLADTLLKTEFWRRHEETPFNARERLMLNKLLDGFEGKLTSSKWAKMTKCSPDTALRDIRSLLARGILKQEEAGGRSTHYTLRPLA